MEPEILWIGDSLIQVQDLNQLYAVLHYVLYLLIN